MAVTDQLVNKVQPVVKKYVYRSESLPKPSIYHTDSRLIADI